MFQPQVTRKRIGMRMLLIEDDSATAPSIELMLKFEGFNVYTTDLGEDGVDLGKLYDYDIILLDLNLPDMSGFDVLRWLRVSKVKTPILILSGLAGIEDKVSGLGYGADDYMTKPFHNDELIARIHAIVRRSKGHAQSVIQSGDLVVNLDTPRSGSGLVGARHVLCSANEFPVPTNKFPVPAKKFPVPLRREFICKPLDSLGD
jgi:two-component system cell cycle response regulator CtrA